MTDYDLMNQAADWKEVLTQARKEKLLILEEGKRVRDYVAAVLKAARDVLRNLRVSLILQNNKGFTPSMSTGKKILPVYPAND